MPRRRRRPVTRPRPPKRPPTRPANPAIRQFVSRSHQPQAFRALEAVEQPLGTPAPELEETLGALDLAHRAPQGVRVDLCPIGRFGPVLSHLPRSIVALVLGRNALAATVDSREGMNRAVRQPPAVRLR